MSMLEFFIVFTVNVGCISPLLTLSKLWQIKEWRIDRMREHLRQEGVITQLFGRVRPIIILISLFISLIFSQYSSAIVTVSCSILAALSGVQIFAQKQSYPVWTTKAEVLVATSVLINNLIIITSIVLHGSDFSFIQLLIIGQIFVLTISWLLWKPLDMYAKNKVLRSAKALRSKFVNSTVIGITGSVGKTTTKELVAHLLSDTNTIVTPAHVNSEMGVAMWLNTELSKRDPTEELTIVVEMGAYRKNEIALLCDMTKPSIGIITYIGSQHIALFGSQEALCNAKAELIESLPADGTAFLNADNKQCESLKDRAKCKTILVGSGDHADVQALDIEETGSGVRFSFENIVIQTKINGTHNISNILLALSSCKRLGLSKEILAKKLETFEPPSKTFQQRTKQGVTILDDSHNASQASFIAAIDWAKSQPYDEVTLLTSGLIELGSKQDDIHKELGALSNGVFSRVIFTSATSAKMFEKGFGSPVEMLNKSTDKVSRNSLLVCEGRVSEHAIDQLLP